MLILLYMYNSTRMNSANVWHKKVWEGLAPCVNWFLMNYQNHKEPNKSNPHIYIKLSAWLAFLVNWCIINTRWTRNQPLPHISTATVKGLFGTLCELVLHIYQTNKEPNKSDSLSTFWRAYAWHLVIAGQVPKGALPNPYLLVHL